MERLSRRSCLGARDRDLADFQGDPQRCQAVRLGRRKPPARARRRKRGTGIVGDRGSARRRRDLDGKARQADPLRQPGRVESLRSGDAQGRAHPPCHRTGARRRCPQSGRSRHLGTRRRVVRHGRIQRRPGHGHRRNEQRRRRHRDRTWRRHRMERAQPQSEIVGGRHLARREFLGRGRLGQAAHPVCRRLGAGLDKHPGGARFRQLRRRRQSCRRMLSSTAR